MATQPNGPVTVRIEITPNQATQNNLRVYHVHEGPPPSLENMNARVVYDTILDKWFMEFETDHFSIYAIVEVAETTPTPGTGTPGSSGGGTSAATDDPAPPAPAQQKWWQALPSLLQLLMKIFLFGWIWM